MGTDAHLSEASHEDGDEEDIKVNGCTELTTDTSSPPESSSGIYRRSARFE